MKKISAILLAIMMLLALFLFYGDNFDLLKKIFLEEHSNEELKEMLRGFGIKGYITVTVLAMLQVVFTFLPAEPIQVISGITFGFPIGLLLCTIGVFLGNTLVYVMYRFWGEKIRDYFVKNLHF